MTCPDDDTLAAITTLPTAQREAIADHAASCDTCRGLVKELLFGVTPTPFAEAATLAEAPPAAPETPTMIDRYRIDRRIGAGAMGVVYGGYDPELARPVAIKVLRSGGSPERMKREAQALAQLAHPNVVAVYDVGEHADSTFVAMALVDGDNLRTWLETPRSTDSIVDAIVQAARGLEVAHAAGIVHRDIKPDNIFVAKTGTVLVGDFGLARTSDELVEAPDRNLVTSSELTQTGAVVGTPAYMAPEQFDGEATAATDLFALCVTAWEALFGRRPFTGADLGELVSAVRAGTPRLPPHPRRVPAHVRAAIRRGLAVDPKQRHPSMAAFVAALGKRRRWPYVVAATIAALAIVGVVAFAPRDDSVSECDAIAAPSGWTLPGAMNPPAVAALDRILGRYATEWQSFARSSCEAASRRELSEPAYAATKRCLEYRKDTLEWIMKQPAAVLSLAEALEPIETCREPSGGDAVPSLELAALQRELAHATVFVQHLPEQAKGLDDLLARAQRSADQTSIAEVHYLLGLARYARSLDPRQSLTAAIGAAEAARNDRIRTRASALLAIDAARAGRLSEATMHHNLAVSAAARASDPVTTIAVERANIELAFTRRDIDAELAAYRRIEAILIARFGELSTSLVTLRFRIAGVMFRHRDPDAKKMLDLAVEGMKQLSDVPPEVALQQVAVAESNPAVRLPTQEQIVELVRRDDPSRLFDELLVLATDYELVGAYDRALQTIREALALQPASPRALTSAIHNAFQIADRSDSDAVRSALLAEALGFVDKLPADTRDSADIQSIHGRVLLRAGRFLEAVPVLSNALVAAERADPQEPYYIGIRSFALAQALWEIGGTRDRERAIALAEQAARRLPEARPAVAAFQDGALLGKLDEQLARIEAWRRAHR